MCWHISPYHMCRFPLDRCANKLFHPPPAVACHHVRPTSCFFPHACRRADPATASAAGHGRAASAADWWAASATGGDDPAAAAPGWPRPAASARGHDSAAAHGCDAAAAASAARGNAATADGPAHPAAAAAGMSQEELTAGLSGFARMRAICM